MDVLHVGYVGYPNLLTQLCLDEGAGLVELFQCSRNAGCATSVDLAVAS